MAVQKQRVHQQQQQQQQANNAIAAQQNPKPAKTNNNNNNNNNNDISNNKTYNKLQQSNKMPSNPSATATATAAATSSSTAAANGGPRVSFNRDVHVKRIGNRPNEQLNYELTNLQPPQNLAPPQYHHLPADLSAENIRKEAALVLEQAERHRSKAESGDNTHFFKVKAKRAGSSTDLPDNKFHSLPTRKRKGAAKPVARSVSDAAARKPNKRPSIFSIFSRKSDSNVAQIDPPIRTEELSSSGRRLVRSKSDVGSTAPKTEDRKYKKLLRETKSPPKSLTGSSKQLPSTQLSPIIEQAQKEDYFAEQFNRERRKSDAITEREKHESGLSELLERSRAQAEVDGPLLFGKNPISHGIKEKILTLQSKSNENMHSSQLPVQKLPLTKGVKVNGMVKRLSMERFSPPPTISGPAFSYTRPNEGITYAQLELNDEHQRKLDLRSPTREIRSPIRDYKSPERLSMERTDFLTSQNNIKNTYSPSYNNNNNKPNNSHRILLDSAARTRDSFSPTATTGPTTIRISSSLSPSPWQQLSPRNLSDEDEGLGIETRKYYDDEPLKPRSKSPAEPPIIPVIRSITPPLREFGYERHRNYMSPARDEPVDDLGYRRARLESRILTRRFGESATLNRNGYQQQTSGSSPERSRQRYYSAEREYEPRYHKPANNEILNKYSPERSHLDIIAPSSATLIKTLPKKESAATKTSRYKHTKYYDDGHGGVKEVYERETRTDAEGKPHVRESRHRERLDSGEDSKREQLSPEAQHNFQDYEPKSLDSQFTSTDQYRSSPEHSKRGLSYQQQQQQRLSSEEHWQSSLKRDKLQQRSFDKGDSGIENDFRKESFNGDITTKWRKRTTIDDMKASDTFLRKERRHTELQHNDVPRRRQQQQRNGGTNNDHDHFVVYRERSIDDGSHFDPHLDKYPVATSTLRRRDQQSQTGQGQDTTTTTSTSTLKRNHHKKLGGFEKVKQLFTGGGGGQNAANKKEMERHARANSTTSSSTQTPPKDHNSNSKDNNNTKDNNNMVKEEEMRSRYREHRANLQHENLRGEPKAIDISTRRRLSTPKASPLLLKRTASDKTRKESPLAKPEKLSWFKSLDRRAKSKSKEKLNVTVNGQNETSSMKRSKKGAAPPIPSKNLRFFGDTDLDSNPPTITKAHTIQKTRPTLATTLNRSQKYSQSAYNLDRLNSSPQRHDYRQTLASASHTTGVGVTRHKSSSMQNLENGGNDEVDFRKRRHFTRSRDLDDISESGSETEEQHKRPNGIAAGRSLSRERLDRTHRYDNEHAYRRSNDHRQATPTTNGVETPSSSMQRRAHHLTAIGPPKPARSAERRVLSSYSRERERFPAESSGTEGESSLHSQRSIVYLHATTVGDIPQPYHLRRRSISRDDLRSNKSNKIQQQQQPLQPMTRTVSRSVSMLAPWKPKLISEGYEINYSQEQNKRMATLPRKAHTNGGGSASGIGGSSSTLTRTSKKSDTPIQHARTRRHEHIKDDQSSLRNSSTTSASKSALSADARRRIK